MKNIFSTLAKTAIVLLSISSFDQIASAHTDQPLVVNQVNADISPDVFIRQATLMGMKELQLSGVANEQSTDAKIKAYAKMMITDHSKANEELKILAKAKGVNLPMGKMEVGTLRPDGRVDSTPENMKDTTRNDNQPEAAGNVTTSAPVTGGELTEADILKSVDELKKLKGTALDRSYVSTMITDHQKAIALFEEGAKSTDAATKKFAAKQLPKLKAHLKHVMTLAQ